MTDQPQPDKPPIKQDEAKQEGVEKKPTPPAEPAQKAAVSNPVPTNGDAVQKPVSTTPTAKTAPPAASSTPTAKTVPPAAPAAKPTEPVAGSSDSDVFSSKPKIDTAPLKDSAAVSGTRDLRDIAKDLTVPSKSTLAERGEGKKDDSQPLPAGEQPKVAQRFPESNSEGATQSAMQICPTCGHRNRPGVLICDNCGTNLMTGSKATIGTRDLVRDQEERKTADKPGEKLLDTAQMKAVEAAGSGVFNEDMVLRIEIEGGTTPMMVYPKQEIIMGRRDPNTGGMPDVDLTSYAGYRMGVSRHHAAIRLQDKQLNLSDLGSSNGTFLNGTRLTAHRPYQVRDGDEIRLGQMVLRVYFQNAKK